jgi:superfamily II DNA or RNA helicase
LAEETRAAWPDGILFWPTLQISWQTDYIARMFLMRSAMLAADLGTGKSVMGLGVAGLAFEQGVIDHVLVVCEPNKLDKTEWPADFERFTRIGYAVYHGPKRKKLLEDLPAALITTYETARDDLAVFPPKGSRSRTLAPGPLAQALTGKRVLVIYDEITKLGRRTSRLYKAHNWFLGQLRKAAPGQTRVIGMSATPMDTDLENIFNEMRLIVPESMPTVAKFDEEVVKSRHPVYGTPTYRQEGKAWFRAQCEPWILRKRKSDPDVREHFPPFTEQFVRLRMHADQYRIYQLLEDLAHDPETHEFREVPGLNSLLRQLAGDPWAVLEAARVGDSALAKMVAEEMGGELQKCSSAKAEQLIHDADLIMSGGGKILAFTFYGQTVLPALVRRLGNRPVYTYHGQMSDAERERQKIAFRDHQGGAIMIASDAGSRGMNMPFLSYVAEYDVARTHATRQQRAGRGHRLGQLDPLTFMTYVLDSTIESTHSMRSLLTRNREQDFILGDDQAEDYVTADDRRELFAQARPRKAG